MSIRIAWGLNNQGTANHDVYISPTPIAWPNNMPEEPYYRANPGEWYIVADVPADQEWYVMVVAWRVNERGRTEKAASLSWYYSGIPSEAAELGGIYDAVGGMLRNTYEHLRVPLPGIRKATLITVKDYTIEEAEEGDRLCTPIPDIEYMGLTTIADGGGFGDTMMEVPVPDIAIMKLTSN